MIRIRTGFSFRTAFGHLEDVISRLKEIGATVAPVTDRCSTFAYTEWTKLAKKSGLRPVYGVELAVTNTLGGRHSPTDYWTFLAKDKLRPVHDLIGVATANPGREPSLLYSTVIDTKGVIKITGERVQLEHIAPAPDLYIPLSPALAKGLYKEAKARGFKFIAVSDNYYPRASDKELYRITLNKYANTQTYPLYIMDDEEWRKSVEWFADKKDIQSALKNRQHALDQCIAEQRVATLLHPEHPMTLREMCERNAPKKGIDLSDPVYRDRLTKELDLIADKQFEDYFYIISDMIDWAKQQMIVGPARGSSCGSLVCYLLNITEIDPIPFDLIFERFIDVTRKDLPDIDIDFSDERRHLVFKYAEDKYGADRVARLGTVGMFQPRSALNQAGIALRIPKWQVDKVLEGQIVRSSGDSRAMMQLEDTLNETDSGRKLIEEFPEVLSVAKMEGHPNNASQHAAGIVITEEPVAEYVAIDRRSNSAMCDKYDAESLNLLKIDALGLTQLSIFERTLELIGKPARNGFLEGLPLDDPLAFEVLNRGHYSGIFQFMGGALKSLAKQFKFEQLEDIIAVTALARPGPMASGGANEWVKRRMGISRVTYPDPIFEPYLSKTLGIVVYQEQVLQIGREVGGMSWAEVTGLRKGMSKSLGKEFFDQYGNTFKKNAIAKGLDPEMVSQFWDDLCGMGSWAFNRSHSVAYGIVSYWCCWLKAHHPLEFAAATLDAEKDPVRQIQLLRELRDEGIDYKPVDKDHSTDRWVPIVSENSRLLVGPLTSIKGLGPKKVSQILTCRRDEIPLPPGIAKLLEKPRTPIDTLYPVRDAVRKVNLIDLKIKSAPTPVIDCQPGIEDEVMIIAVITKIAPRDENDPAKVAQRGGRKLSGPTWGLNMFFRDDTDDIFCKIDRFRYEELAHPIMNRGRTNRAIYAVKGYIPKDFRMISVRNIRYICDLEDEYDENGRRIESNREEVSA